MLDFLENADLFFKISVRFFCDGRSLFRDHLDAGLDVLDAFSVGVVIQVGVPIDDKGNDLIFALQKREFTAVAADIVPDASCLIVKAKSVQNGVLPGCFALGKLRDFVVALCYIPGRDAETRADVGKDFISSFVFVDKGVLVVGKVDTVIVGGVIELLFAALALIQQDAAKAFLSVHIENALVAIFHVNSAAGVFVAVIVDHGHGQGAGRTSLATFPVDRLHKGCHVRCGVALNQKQLNFCHARPSFTEFSRPARAGLDSDCCRSGTCLRCRCWNTLHRRHRQTLRCCTGSHPF